VRITQKTPAVLKGPNADFPAFSDIDIGFMLKSEMLMRILSVFEQWRKERFSAPPVSGVYVKG
jgi:hypothetical protein